MNDHSSPALPDSTVTLLSNEHGPEDFCRATREVECGSCGDAIAIEYGIALHIIGNLASELSLYRRDLREFNASLDAQYQAEQKKGDQP